MNTRAKKFPFKTNKWNLSCSSRVVFESELLKNDIYNTVVVISHFVITWGSFRSDLQGTEATHTSCFSCPYIWTHNKGEEEERGSSIGIFDIDLKVFKSAKKKQLQLFTQSTTALLHYSPKFIGIGGTLQCWAIAPTATSDGIENGRQSLRYYLVQGPGVLPAFLNFSFQY